MSDPMTRLREEVQAWSAPARDIDTVIRDGRRRSFLRGVGWIALLAVVLGASVAVVRAWDTETDLVPVGSTFDLIRTTGQMNGVILEEATPDDSWLITETEAQGEPSLLPGGLVPVLVTSPRLARGLEAQPAWADLIDGWAPGPARLDDEDEDPNVPRVYLTLRLMSGGVAYLPATAPYEWWGAGERPSVSTFEPAPVTTSLAWEGVIVEHPVNWRRLTESSAGASPTLAGLTITNMYSIPPGWGLQNDGDMDEAPSDAVIFELTKLEGGPEGLGACDPDGSASCGGTEGPAAETVDAAGNRTGSFSIDDVYVSFWVGRDASEAEMDAFERMRPSVEPRKNDEENNQERTSSQEGFALWPGDDRQSVQEDCSTLGSGSGITSDPSSIALEFGAEKLGWDDAIAIDLGKSSDHRELELRRDADDDGQEPRGAAVRVWVREVEEGCWFVTSVSRLPDHRPTGVSISVEGREFSIGFMRLGADEVRGEIYYGEMGTNLLGAEGETIFKGKLGTRPRSPGHFLLLFRDESGRVFSATGGPLPAGDFSAG